MSNPIIEKAQTWLNPVFDKETQATVSHLIENDIDELTESFYTDLDFGTGGLRGIMGVGTNRINKYTLGMATQGLSNYLNNEFNGQNISVAIAHDSRNNSKSFARQVAEVFTANGIKVYLFEDLRPTPELSFAIRHLGCQSGVVLTASHNPKEYNGYKVYWNDGAQLVPPHDNNVIAEVRKVTAEDIKFDFDENLIEYIGKDIDEAYLSEMSKLSLGDSGKDNLDIVFTALHGTSITLVPDALKKCGFTNVSLVEQQSTPDGNFPTVPSPNPEEGAALQMAVDLANQKNADLVVGCDPDTDRVGIAVRNLEGKMELLNGNQTAAVLFYYILHQYKAEGKLKGNEFVAETIVTSDLIEKVADHFGIECIKCLTGFKWIAEIIKNEEGKKNFIVGGEESYGYLIGDFVRDKDAVSATVLIAEAAAWAKANGGSFYETLIDIYHKLGFYLESLISIKKEGKSGKEEIAKMMEDLRNNPPKSIAGSEVIEVLDYSQQKKTNLQSGEVSKIDLPKSNVIQILTTNGDKVTARPSGTEPKIKFYFSVQTELKDKNEFAQTKEKLEAKIELIQKEMHLV
ncbi:MAG: phospho-sugar mutase [Schleiferiaceae bacterium]|jgi:phosphoglucomutase|nr:phospho-sugar mutase [Schleiferiaceae bacterium]